MQDAPLPKGVKYRYMEHGGVIFPAAYVPHGIRMKYDGAEVCSLYSIDAGFRLDDAKVR